MRFLVLTFSLFAAMLLGCDRARMSNEPTAANVPYKVVNAEQASALLMVDWKGGGRDVVTGTAIEIPAADLRRKTFVSINFMSKGPMPWRSILDRRLKLRELRPDDVRTEPVDDTLVRAYVIKDSKAGDFFFRQGVGADLSSDYYLAQCSTLPPDKYGAVGCSTYLDVESFAVKIIFDKAFLWDVDNLSTQAVVAAKDYILKPETQRSIESIPRLQLPTEP